MSKFPKPVIVGLFLLAKLPLGEQGITSFSVKFLSEGRRLITLGKVQPLTFWLS
jgi:hypothetical protein